MTALEIQIKRIIENLQPDEAAKEILRLFGVVGRSEQLACGNPTHSNDMIENGYGRYNFRKKNKQNRELQNL